MRKMKKPNIKLAKQAEMTLTDDWVRMPLKTSGERRKAAIEFADKRADTIGDDPKLLSKYIEAGLDVLARGGVERHYMLLTRNVLMMASVERISVSLDDAIAQLEGTNYLEAEWHWGPMYRAWAVAGDDLEVDYWLDPNDGGGVFHAMFRANRSDDVEGMLEYFDSLIGTLEVPGDVEEAK